MKFDPQCYLYPNYAIAQSQPMLCYCDPKHDSLIRQLCNLLSSHRATVELLVVFFRAYQGSQYAIEFSIYFMAIT